MGRKEATAGDDVLPAVRPRERMTRWQSWLGGRLDRAGIVWSALCTLHCAAPLAIAGAAFIAGTAHAHGSHAHGMHSGAPLVLVVTSVVFAGLLLGRSYFSKHRDWRPLGMFGVAATVLGLAAFNPWGSEATGMIASAAGFAGLVVAQLVNLALVRRSRGCCAERCCC